MQYRLRDQLWPLARQFFSYGWERRAAVPRLPRTRHPPGTPSRRSSTGSGWSGTYRHLASPDRVARWTSGFAWRLGGWWQPQASSLVPLTAVRGCLRNRTITEVGHCKRGAGLSSCIPVSIQSWQTVNRWFDAIIGDGCANR